MLSQEAGANKRGCLPFYETSITLFYGGTGASFGAALGAFLIHPGATILPISAGLVSGAIASEQAVVRDLINQAHHYVKKENSKSKAKKHTTKLKIFLKALKLTAKKSSYQQIDFNDLSIPELARYIHEANQKKLFCKNWPLLPLQTYPHVLHTVKKYIKKSSKDNLNEFSNPY